MSWHMQKINDGGVSVGPDAAGFIPNDMFVCVFTDQQHFTYRDGNGNLQDVWYDGPNNRWNLQQINNANGNGPTVPGEFIASVQATAPAERGIFVSTFTDQQHFTYLDANGNLQDVWYDGPNNRWNLQQINNANGKGPTVPGEFIASAQATAPAESQPFVCVFNDQQHFTYLDGSGNLQDVWYDGPTNRWNLQQINNANGKGATVPGEFIAAAEATAPADGGLFVCTFTDQQHFTYRDANGNLQDVWYDGPTNRWNLQQINNANGNGPTVPGEFIASAQATAPAESQPFVCVFTDQQHFTYLDGNGNLQDVWYDGPTNRWNLQQINNANGNGPTVPGEFIASAEATAPAEIGLFVSTFTDQQHFTYRDGNGNLQDVWYDGPNNQWNLQQINNANGKGPTVPGEFIAVPSAPAASLINPFVCTFTDQQHFVYRSGANPAEVFDCWWGN